MAKRKKKSIFGFDIEGEIERQRKDMTKSRRKQTLGMNVFRGKMAEKIYETGRRVQGYNVKRKAHGSDYEEQRVDLITGRPIGRKTLVEIKTGRAKLSKLQKKTRKKKKGRYRVERSGFY